MTTHWQLDSPVNTIIFDCDGTLSSIEGIDELASHNKLEKQVKALTADAMGKTGIYPELYQKRLELVRPTQQQVLALGEHYFAHVVPDIMAVINIFKRLNKTIYIISAGLYPAVAIFGEKLQIAKENIFAVGIKFDAHGNYLDFDHTSPLTHREGKKILIAELKKSPAELLYVGDGLNDLAAIDLVKRFIGYGGFYYRENIAEQCEFYLSSKSMSPLLALGLTESEIKMLSVEEKKLYEKGLSSLSS